MRWGPSAGEANWEQILLCLDGRGGEGEAAEGLSLALMEDSARKMKGLETSAHLSVVVDGPIKIQRMIIASDVAKSDARVHGADFFIKRLCGAIGLNSSTTHTSEITVMFLGVHCVDVVQPIRILRWWIAFYFY